MNRSIIFTVLFFAFTSLFSLPSFATNNDEGLDEVCSLADGKWHTSASGWACCWANWGCYGCTGGNCVMTCRTPRCKKANGMAKVSTNHIMVEGLAPNGMKAPIVPKPVKGIKPTNDINPQNMKKEITS